LGSLASPTAQPDLCALQYSIAKERPSQLTLCAAQPVLLARNIVRGNPIGLLKSGKRICDDGVLTSFRAAQRAGLLTFALIESHNFRI